MEKIVLAVIQLILFLKLAVDVKNAHEKGNVKDLIVYCTLLLLIWES